MSVRLLIAKSISTKLIVIHKFFLVLREISFFKLPSIVFNDYKYFTLTER